MPHAMKTAPHPGGPRSPRKIYDDARGSAASRGYGRRHEKWRLLILHRDPLCKIAKICKGEAPSTIADHVIPLRSTWAKLTPDQRERVRQFFCAGYYGLVDPEAALKQYLWAEENGQGACQACHNWKTRMERSS